MKTSNIVDFEYAERVETSAEYAIREAIQFLLNRGFHIESAICYTDENCWHWIHSSDKRLVQNSFDTKEQAIIDAFVYLAHNPNITKLSSF